MLVPFKVSFKFFLSNVYFWFVFVGILLIVSSSNWVLMWVGLELSIMCFLGLMNGSFSSRVYSWSWGLVQAVLRFLLYLVFSFCLINPTPSVDGLISVFGLSVWILVIASLIRFFILFVVRVGAAFFDVVNAYFELLIHNHPKSTEILCHILLFLGLCFFCGVCLLLLLYFFAGTVYAMEPDSWPSSGAGHNAVIQGGQQLSPIVEEAAEGVAEGVAGESGGVGHSGVTQGGQQLSPIVEEVAEGVAGESGGVGHSGVTQGGQQPSLIVEEAAEGAAEEVAGESGGPSPGSSWLESTRNFLRRCCSCCNGCNS